MGELHMGPIELNAAVTRMRRVETGALRKSLRIGATEEIAENRLTL